MLGLLQAQVLGQTFAVARGQSASVLTCLLLEEREGEYVSVADLVAATGVSVRTLRTAFNETFGVGPLRYLQLRDLHRIRRALRAAEPEETLVAEVLTQHGEWQFGRCAARYQRLFGELPSETLQATRR